MDTIINAYRRLGLVPAIIIGLVAGVMVGQLMPTLGQGLGLLGDLFVGALKAVAPLLVFVLVLSALGTHKHSDSGGRIKPVLVLYLFGTFMAALTAVVASMVFPVELAGLMASEAVEQAAPTSLQEVLKNLAMNVVQNPIRALVEANYIGVLAWAVLIGFGLRGASEQTKTLLSDLSQAVTGVVRWIIWLAPLGIFGLVAYTVATTGFVALASYAKVLILLVGCMLFVAFVGNALIVFAKTRQNPYPLILTCLKQSGITAFFTRSSAANIPVNMALAKQLGLDKDTYSVTIPLGATINMAGAAITINVLTLAAAYSMGISVDFGSALLLALVSAISACGASGVPGGSLLLIPLACGLFNIPNDIAMKVVAIGIIISVVQDSAETALNSSTDVLFTAAADPRYRK